MARENFGSPQELEEFERAVLRLRSNPDFKIVLKALERRLEAYKTGLIVQEGIALTRLQGAGSELLALLHEFNKTPKE